MVKIAKIAKVDTFFAMYTQWIAPVNRHRPNKGGENEISSFNVTFTGHGQCKFYL
jgi:hypothetical protein